MKKRILSSCIALSCAIGANSWTSTVHAQAQTGVPHADRFTRAAYGSSLGTSTYGNTWIETPFNFFPVSNTDNADFKTVFDANTANGELQLGALGAADTTTASLDVDMNQKATYTVRFSLRIANVSNGNAGLFVMPRAEGTDVANNAGWIFRQATAGASASIEVRAFTPTTRSGSPPVLPLPAAVALTGLNTDVPHAIQINVSNNTATLFVNDTKVGSVTTATHANTNPDRVMLGYSAFSSSANNGFGAFIDDFSVALPVTHASAVQVSRFSMNARKNSTTATDNDTSDAEWFGMWLGNVKYVRAGFNWSAIEAVKNVYDFSGLELLMDKLDDYQMKRVGLLAYGDKGDENAVPPEPDIYPGIITGSVEREAYVRWAGAMANEYRHRGVIWEIWNEPNNPTFWPVPAGTFPSAAEYMKLLNPTVAAIKAGDPTAVVVSGGIDGLSWAHTVAFLDGCVDRHLLTKVDGLGVHLYDDQAKDDPAVVQPEPNNPSVERIIGELADVRRRIVAKPGHTPIPIYNTEWGTGYNAEHVSETRKAEALVRMNLLSAMEDLKLNSWFNWRHSPKGGDPDKNIADVVNGELQYRIAYSAITTMNAQLAGYSYERRVDLGSGVNSDVYALVFKNGTNRKVALWSARTPQRVAIPVSNLGSKQYDAVKMTEGNLPVGKVTAEAGRIHVEATTSPLYINLVGDNANDNGKLSYRFQLETLRPAAGAPSTIRVFNNPAASGGTTQRLEGVTNNVWQYTAPVSLPANTTYHVMMRNLQSSNGATYQLKVAGQDQGAPVNLRVSPTEMRAPTELGTPRSVSGAVPFSFTLTTNGVIWNDYIEFVPTVQTFLAEQIAQKSDNINVARFVDGTNPMDRFEATAPGQTISYTVPLSRKGDYTVSVGFKRQTAAGTFRLEVPEMASPVIGTASQANPALNNVVTFTTKASFATPGNKEFKFIVTAPNGGSHQLTVDYIRLQ